MVAAEIFDMDTISDYSFDRLSDYFEILKQKMRVAVVFGGDKSRPGSVLYQTFNPRPWKSYEIVAKDIMDTLEEIGFKNVVVMPDDMTLLDNLKKEKIHLAWLNTGGVQGYIPTSHAAAMLEMAGVPYVGPNPQNAAILDNKHVFKYMLEKFGIRTSPFVVWSRSSLSASLGDDLESLESVFGDYRGPFIVKPVSGRASININIVDCIDALPEAVDLVHDITQNLVVVEKYLSGSEYCVSISGPITCVDGVFVKKQSPFAFSVLERILDKDELIFTSMDKKPITDTRARLCGSEADQRTNHAICLIAQEIYTKFFLETLVRVDLRADEHGQIYVLEANPKPDLKKPTTKVTSLTCLGLSEHEMSYSDLIAGLLADRLDYLFRYRKQNALHLEKLLA